MRQQKTEGVHRNIWPKGFQKPMAFPIQIEPEKSQKMNSFLLDKYKFFISKLIVSIVEETLMSDDADFNPDEDVLYNRHRNKKNEIILDKSSFVMDFYTLTKDHLLDNDPDYFDAAFDSMLGRIQSSGLNLFIEKIETPKCRLIRILL